MDNSCSYSGSSEFDRNNRMKEENNCDNIDSNVDIWINDNFWGLKDLSGFGDNEMTGSNTNDQKTMNRTYSSNIAEKTGLGLGAHMHTKQFQSSFAVSASQSQSDECTQDDRLFTTPSPTGYGSMKIDLRMKSQCEGNAHGEGVNSNNFLNNSGIIIESSDIESEFGSRYVRDSFYSVFSSRQNCSSDTNSFFEQTDTEVTVSGPCDSSYPFDRHGDKVLTKRKAKYFKGPAKTYVGIKRGLKEKEFSLFDECMNSNSDDLLSKIIQHNNENVVVASDPTNNIRTERSLKILGPVARVGNYYSSGNEYSNNGEGATSPNPEIIAKLKSLTKQIIENELKTQEKSMEITEVQNDNKKNYNNNNKVVFNSKKINTYKNNSGTNIHKNDSSNNSCNCRSGSAQEKKILSRNEGNGRKSSQFRKYSGIPQTKLANEKTVQAKSNLGKYRNDYLTSHNHNKDFGRNTNVDKSFTDANTSSTMDKNNHKKNEMNLGEEKHLVNSENKDKQRSEQLQNTHGSPGSGYLPEFLVRKCFDEYDFKSRVVEYCTLPSDARNIIIPIDKEKASDRMIDIIFREITVGDRMIQIMESHCGNYVVQRLIPKFNQRQILVCLRIITNNISMYKRLCENIYATRCVQAFISSLWDIEDSTGRTHFINRVVSFTVKGLDCFVYDKTAHNVVIKLLNTFSEYYTTDIYDYIRTNMMKICMNKFGCIVAKAALRKTVDFRQVLFTIIADNVEILSKNEFGNYIVQLFVDLCCSSSIQSDNKILEKTIDIMLPSIPEFSRHRYASNVIETLLCIPNEIQKEKVVDSVLKSPEFVNIANDRFGNYVIQIIYKRGNSEVKQNILDILSKAPNSSGLYRKLLDD